VARACDVRLCTCRTRIPCYKRCTAHEKTQTREKKIYIKKFSFTILSRVDKTKPICLYIDFISRNVSELVTLTYISNHITIYCIVLYRAGLFIIKDKNVIFFYIKNIYYSQISIILSTEYINHMWKLFYMVHCFNCFLKHKFF